MKSKFTIIALLIGFVAFAQGPKREKVKAFKVAFITEQLDLTPDEAQKFWPVYNSYSDKMEEIYRAERVLLRSMKGDFEAMSDTNAQQNIDTLLSNEQSRINAKKALTIDLKNIISSKKMLILFKAEEDFKRRLLKQLRDRRERGGRN